jgi:DNA ligase-1
MKHFASLIQQLDQTTKTGVKLQALEAYLCTATEEDKVWAVALLMGRRPKRPVRAGLLRQWAAERADVPLWLLEESYYIVGDLAETIAMVLPPPTGTSVEPLSYYMQALADLHRRSEQEAQALVTQAWSNLSTVERFVFNKLITGGFRIGVSQKLMVRALAAHYGVEESNMAHKLMGYWSPESTSLQALVSESSGANLSRPYPFYLAYPIEEPPESLGPATQWQLEYKWDGIRGQLIYRKGDIFIWSRGEELVTDRFPELRALAAALPSDCVIDGEILAWKDGSPLSFNHLQTRIGRKTITKTILQHSPAALMAYDLLELEGRDLRSEPLAQRRKKLEKLVSETAHAALLLSQSFVVQTWDEAAAMRTESRNHAAEGLMVKHLDSPYLAGRKRGSWWKWKVDPMSIDAVLVYAMRGHGRRANLYSDYTFALWHNGLLVPFTKAYSGLTDAEMQEVDRFVKKNTIEKFGPVRSVTPQLVFEIGFEGIAPSTRHKSGVALRFPRMLRWRQDKKPADANTLEQLKDLMATFQKGG